MNDHPQQWGSDTKRQVSAEAVHPTGLGGDGEPEFESPAPRWGLLNERIGMDFWSGFAVGWYCALIFVMWCIIVFMWWHGIERIVFVG